jgi:hypothetical protein
MGAARTFAYGFKFKSFKDILTNHPRVMGLETIED